MDLHNWFNLTKYLLAQNNSEFLKKWNKHPQPYCNTSCGTNTSGGTGAIGLFTDICKPIALLRTEL